MKLLLEFERHYRDFGGDIQKDAIFFFGFVYFDFGTERGRRGRGRNDDAYRDARNSVAKKKLT